MDSKPHTDNDYTSDSASEHPESASYGGAMFSGSQDFMVAGGTFHNVTNNYTTASTVPPDFRSIPLGDIYLQNELELDRGSHTVGHLRDRGFVRRVYSARVVGLDGNLTVAMYQGDGAQKEWREDILRYTWLRNPYFVQLWGITTSSTMHAAVFYDDLIPVEQFFELYRHSSILTAYIHGYCNTEFEVTWDYSYSSFKRSLDQGQCTFWICRSTGRLRTEFRPSQGPYFPWISTVG
ncbi:hypothetical protein DFH07DRAFT_957593 [Mycena maculata]|uniref:Uncharacterized protein n=1 Tax=Mycena maculata TaxID=230809 RepID=A0AAD7J9L0_9AGAR|nr:hypothetical protein DFH07DRAFT_957593 [Mycena maculata]